MIGRVAAAAVAVGCLGSGLAAQPRAERPDRSTWLSLLAGPTVEQLEGQGGQGRGFAAGLRFEVPSGRYWIVEPGIGFLRYRSALGDRITYLLPEVGLQVQTPSGAVRPYLGVGGGFSEYLSGRGTTYGTLHVATGLRIRLESGWGIRGDLRVRSIDPFAFATTDLTVGVSKRLR